MSFRPRVIHNAPARPVVVVVGVWADRPPLIAPLARLNAETLEQLTDVDSTTHDRQNSRHAQRMRAHVASGRPSHRSATTCFTAAGGT